MNISSLSLLALLLVISISSCHKNDAETTGRFAAYPSCSIIAPPTPVHLDPYYTKYLNCNGIAIVAGDSVPDEALYAADSIATYMISGLDAVQQKLLEAGGYVALSPGNNAVASLPEWTAHGITGGSRGGFILADAVVGTCAANLLCQTDTANNGIESSILVHEFTHLIDQAGLRVLYPDFENELQAAYDSAMANGLWANTYAAGSKEEYLAELMRIWYEVKTTVGPPEGNGAHNNIVRRVQLQFYDDWGYILIFNYFNPYDQMPCCSRLP